MILPDAMPVADNHLNVIGGQIVSMIQKSGVYDVPDVAELQEHDEFGDDQSLPCMVDAAVSPRVTKLAMHLGMANFINGMLDPESGKSEL